MRTFRSNGTGPDPNHNGSGAASDRATGRLLCPLCYSDNPKERYNHWLSFDSEDALEAHARDTWGWKPGAAADILRSYREVRATWSGCVSPHTGAPLHWRDARAMAFEHARTEQAQRMQQRSQDQAAAPSHSTTVPELVRQCCAHLRPSSDPYVAAHQWMIAHGLGAPSRWRDTAAFCHEMAEQYPKDALLWRSEASQYEIEMAIGVGPDGMVDF